MTAPKPSFAERAMLSTLAARLFVVSSFPPEATMDLVERDSALRALRQCLAGAATRPSYDEIGAALGLPTTTVTNHLAAMRRQFRAIVLDRLREITGSDDEWEAEARRLLRGDW